MFANSEITEVLSKCGECMEVTCKRNKALAFKHSSFGKGVVCKLDTTSTDDVASVETTDADDDPTEEQQANLLSLIHFHTPT